MVRLAQLEIHKEEFAFSAGHFTIFSATERETLHGHNYSVGVTFNIQISHNGLSFDYRYYKKKIQLLCDQIDRHFLLPNASPYLKIEDGNEYWHVYFNQKKLFFLKEDVVILPLTNITIEELSYWFLQNMLKDQPEMLQHAVQGLCIKVYNGGQSGSATWGSMES